MWLNDPKRNHPTGGFLYSGTKGWVHSTTFPADGTDRRFCLLPSSLSEASLCFPVFAQKRTPVGHPEENRSHFENGVCFYRETPTERDKTLLDSGDDSSCFDLLGVLWIDEIRFAPLRNHG